MTPPSMARSFFDQIRTAADPVAFIRGLVNSTPPTFETDWLDFKQQPSSDLKNPKWREMWVEALAGFANNQGGVIVWGLDARKNAETGVDAACGERPLDNPQGVKSRLIELQRQATDPPLGNVEIEAYEIPSAPGTGFVVCLVPEGPFKPYRAEEGGRRSQYLIRAGDNFVVMSRSMLQAMFHPRPRAVFRARASLSWSLLEGPASREMHFARMSCVVELVNDGTATARNTLVLLRPVIQGDSSEITYSSEGWVASTTPLGKEFAAARPMHPGRVAHLFYAEWQVEARASRSMGHLVVPYCPAPTFDLAVFCDDHERQVFRIEFDLNELLENRQCLREVKSMEGQ